MSSEKNSSVRIVIGIVLIFMGLTALMDNFDYFNLYIPYQISDLLFSPESFFVLIGIILLSMRRKSAGIIFLILGLFGFFPDFWPLIFVFIGIYIMYRRDTGTKNKEGLSESDIIDDVSIFGGGKKIISSMNFAGGKTTAIFGGSEIDLRNSILAEGNQVIDVFAIFGGTTFVISDEWDVTVDVIPIFGGFSDKRVINPTTEKTGNNSLTIKGFVIFGGGEVRC